MRNMWLKITSLHFFSIYIHHYLSMNDTEKGQNERLERLQRKEHDITCLYPLTVVVVIVVMIVN